MSAGGTHRSYLAVVAALTAWLLLWLALTSSTLAAGGHPTVSPVDLIDVRRLWIVIARDKAIVLWHVMGASGGVSAWRFWLVLAVSLVTLPGGCLYVIRLLARRHSGIAIMKPLDATRWARFVDLHGLLGGARTGRFVLGRRAGMSVAAERETSVLVIGPTRSGKTSSLVIPNVLEWDGPAVVTSTKSEIVDVTIGYRQTVGPVHVYDPTGESPRYKSLQWSPLTNCDDLDHAWRVATWLCAALQNGSGRTDNDWAHWSESGRLLVAPLLFTAAVSARSIVDVQSWIHGFDLITPLGLLDEIATGADVGLAQEASRAMTMLASVDQRPEKERGTVFSTVMRIFNAFNERAVAASAIVNRFDAAAFLRQSGTLYLCTPRQSPERIASLFVGLLMTIVTSGYAIAEESHNGRLAHPLGLFLDELTNIVPVDELPAIASQAAGRGILLMSIVQDVSQLRSRYGADKTYSILNNHTCKVLLPGIGDPETAEVLTKLVGQRWYVDVQRTLGADGRSSRSFQRRLQPLAPPDLLRQLRDGTGLIVHRGRAPLLLHLRPWWRSKRLRRRAGVVYLREAESVQRAA